MRQFGKTLGRVTAVIGLATVAIFVAGIPASAAPAYTALGDSYSSGVGSYTYYNDGTNCQRSPYAYPVLDAPRLGAVLTFAACSGATTADVQNTQLGSLSASTSYVTVSAGGNDAGFADVITACALPWPFTCWTNISNANNFITNTLPGRLDSLYSAIRSHAPNARIVVVGYPRLFNGQECSIAPWISSGEQAELNHTADLLATTIGARAAAHGFEFADVRGIFTGHAICDAVEWVNGLSFPIGESYHPNTTGHSSGYAGVVENALRGLVVGSAA